MTKETKQTLRSWKANSWGEKFTYRGLIARVVQAEEIISELKDRTTKISHVRSQKGKAKGSLQNLTETSDSDSRGEENQSQEEYLKK